MSNNLVRAIWIIPIIFLYLAFFFLLYFIFSNFSGLKELNVVGIYTTMSILVLLVGIFGSVTIFRWIKEGKI